MDHDTTGTTAVAGALAGKVERSGPLGFLDVLAMGTDVADALAARPGAHGDVNPGAIVEDPAAGDGAWSLREPGAGTAGGPAVALAPELSPGDANGPGDVYALGAAMVFALTARPFNPDAGGDADTASDPTADDAGSSAGGEAAGDGADDERTLPEVMASFLATLRATLASDPAARPSAAVLAGSLRALRLEADQAMQGVAASGTTSTQVVMIDADGRLLNGDGQVIGTTRTDDKKSSPQWLPLVIAAVALLVAAGAVLAYVRRPDTTVAAPTTTAATTTTTLPVTTTIPLDTIPPSTLPAGLVSIQIDTSKSLSCRNCAVTLRSLPNNTAAITAQLPDKTELWAKCFATGENFNESGYNTNQWLLIAGPSGIQGWISTAWVGRQTWGLPACPPVATPAPTTTAPPTTVPTTEPSTTVPTTVPTTATTVAPTTTIPRTSTTEPLSPVDRP